MSHQQHADNVEGITPYCRDTCKHEQVQQMFDNIAAAYDRLNAMMTFGMSRRWLRSLVSEAANATPTHVLDIATGTGDVALALAHKIPQAHIDGIDLSQGMLDVAAAKISREATDVTGRIVLKCGDNFVLLSYSASGRPYPTMTALLMSLPWPTACATSTIWHVDIPRCTAYCDPEASCWFWNFPPHLHRLCACPTNCMCAAPSPPWGVWSAKTAAPITTYPNRSPPSRHAKTCAD